MMRYAACVAAAMLLQVSAVMAHGPCAAGYRWCAPCNLSAECLPVQRGAFADNGVDLVDYGGCDTSPTSSGPHCFPDSPMAPDNTANNDDVVAGVIRWFMLPLSSMVVGSKSVRAAFPSDALWQMDGLSAISDQVYCVLWARDWRCDLSQSAALMAHKNASGLCDLNCVLVLRFSTFLGSSATIKGFTSIEFIGGLILALYYVVPCLWPPPEMANAALLCHAVALTVGCTSGVVFGNFICVGGYILNIMAVPLDNCLRRLRPPPLVQRRGKKRKWDA